MYKIGVDLGATKIECIATTEDPLNVLGRQRIQTNREGSYADLMHRLVAAVKELQQPYANQDWSLGLGMPGKFSKQEQKVVSSSVQAIVNQPLARDLSQALGCPANVANDAECFALSEAKLGAGKGFQKIAGVILGTGLGCGLVIDGESWSGRHGYAAEIGHVKIDPNSGLCWCGQKGCQELFVSGTAASRMFKQTYGQQKSFTELDQAFRSQDPEAVEFIKQWLFYFGRVMSNLITVFDPEVIVLGGGVSKAQVLYQEGLKAIEQQLFSDCFYTKIVPNQLGDASGVYGAVLLA